MNEKEMRRETKILKLMSLNRYTAIVPHHKHEKEITEMFMLLFPLLGDLWQFFFSLFLSCASELYERVYRKLQEHFYFHFIVFFMN